MYTLLGAQNLYKVLNTWDRLELIIEHLEVFVVNHHHPGTHKLGFAAFVCIDTLAEIPNTYDAPLIAALSAQPQSKPKPINRRIHIQ